MNAFYRSSNAILLSIIFPALYFAYICDLPLPDLVALIAFSISALLLGFTFDLKKIEKLRLAALLVFLCLVLFQVTAQSYTNSLRNVDAHIFFTGAQAVRQNQSPYSGPGASGLNLGFVPIYILCVAMGSSFSEFCRNLLLIDSISIILCGVVILLAVLGFFLKIKPRVSESVEILLEATTVSLLLYESFIWNRSYGNFCGMIALLLLLSIVFHHLQRPFVTGLVLGIAISIKPYFLSVGVGYATWALIRKDRMSLKAGTIALLLLIVTPLVLELFTASLGIKTYIEFFSLVSRERIPGMLNNVGNISMIAILRDLLDNFGIKNNSPVLTAVTIVVSLLAYAGGAFLCIKDSRKHMPTDHLIYYLLLPTAISPLLWERYFCWLLGPVLYIIFKSRAF